MPALSEESGAGGYYTEYNIFIIALSNNYLML